MAEAYEISGQETFGKMALPVTKQVQRPFQADTTHRQPERDVCTKPLQRLAMASASSSHTNRGEVDR